MSYSICALWLATAMICHAGGDLSEPSRAYTWYLPCTATHSHPEAVPFIVSVYGQHLHMPTTGFLIWWTQCLSLCFLPLVTLTGAYCKARPLDGQFQLGRLRYPNSHFLSFSNECDYLISMEYLFLNSAELVFHQIFAAVAHWRWSVSCLFPRWVACNLIQISPYIDLMAKW